jgi:hypothetical protein
MSTEHQIIACNKVRFSTGKRGLSSAVLDQLYDSIAKEGLYNAIVVRPDPEKPDGYVIVQGRQRFYVVAKLLKEKFIKAHVFTDMSNEEAELATLSENACRSHAKPNDRLLHLRKWQELYKKHFPLLQGKKASGVSRWANSAKADAKAKAVKDERKADAALDAANPEGAGELSNAHTGHYSDTTTTEVEVGADAGEPKANTDHQTFRDRVKAVTGVSDSTLTRDLKINANLSEDQIYFLGLVECTKLGMIKIIDAAPDDEQKRAEIVNLVACGMEAEQAIASVVGVTTTTDAAGRVKEVETKEVGDASLDNNEPPTDEEWFERECGHFAQSLMETDQYKSDAILYRQINEERYKFREKVRTIVEEHKAARRGKKVGWFFLGVHTLLNVAHPKAWLVCSACNGDGLDKETGRECGKCGASCYRPTTER